MSDLPDRLRDLADLLVAAEWDFPITAEDCRAAAAELDQMADRLLAANAAGYAARQAEEEPF